MMQNTNSAGRYFCQRDSVNSRELNSSNLNISSHLAIHNSNFNKKNNYEAS